MYHRWRDGCDYFQHYYQNNSDYYFTPSITIYHHYQNNRVRRRVPIVLPITPSSIIAVTTSNTFPSSTRLYSSNSKVDDDIATSTDAAAATTNDIPGTTGSIGDDDEESVIRNYQYWEQLIYDAYCEYETDGIVQLGTTTSTNNGFHHENDTMDHGLSHMNHHHHHNNNPITHLTTLELWERTQAAAHRVAFDRHVSRNSQSKNRSSRSNNTNHQTTTSPTKPNPDPAIFGSSVPWTGIAASMLNGWLAAVGCSGQTMMDITTHDNHHHHSVQQQERVRYAEELFRIATKGSDSATHCNAGKTKSRNNQSKPCKNANIPTRNKNTTSLNIVEPDLVTYSLLYTLLYPTEPVLAESYLHLAQRQSKKIAGTQRRKLLSKASSVLRPTNGAAITTFQDYETELRTLFLLPQSDTTTASTDDCNNKHNDPLILYENENYIVLNKPSGTCCYHTHTTTAGKRNVDLSVVDILQKFRSGTSGSTSLSTLNPAALGTVHRLDRGTSGCLIMAKNDETHARFVAAMFQRQFQKTYTVLVSPAPCIQLYNATTGYITIPVHGKPAKSKYTIIERFVRYNNINNTNETAALMNVTTYTGRQHQVRVHCSYGLGTPIIGDTLYSVPVTSRTINTPKTMKINSRTSTKMHIDNDQAMQRFHLHATNIALPIQFEVNTNITHQTTTAQTETIIYQAPIPTWWQPVLAEWRRQPI